MKTIQRLMKPSRLHSIPGAWNADGYILPPEAEPSTRCLQLPCGSVWSSDRESGRLVRLDFSQRPIQIEILTDPTFRSFMGLEPYEIHVELVRGPDLQEADIADAVWAAPSGTFYLVDIRNALIHRYNFWKQDNPLKPLKIPRNLALTKDCRLTFRPESDYTNTLYLSIPADHIIVRIRESTAATQTHCGVPGQEGKSPNAGEVAAHTRLSEPSALFYDEHSKHLVFFNRSNSRLFFVDEAGLLRHAVDDPLSFSPSCILVYRQSDYVDKLKRRQSGRETKSPWGISPTLLLAANRETSAMWKTLLNSDEATFSPIQGLFLPGVSRLIPLQDGSLLIAQEHSSMLLRTMFRDKLSPGPNSPLDQLLDS
jgi:hypothetical protein